MIRGHSGMSLIELVIAMAVGAVMLTAVSYLAASTMRFFAQADRDGNISDIHESVKVTLTSKTQCTNNFLNIALTSSDVNGVPLTKISNFDQNSNITAALVETAKDYRGVTVSKLLLRPVAAAGTNLLIANLEINLKTSNGANEFTRVVPLYARMQNGKIKECWSKKEQQSANPTEANVVCEEVSSGAKRVYDPVLKKCVTGKAKWVVGDLRGASCPPGWQMPKDGGAYTACKGQVDPMYWDDPIAQVPVTLQDGTVLASSRAAIKHLVDNGSCVCAWADDLPAKSLTNANCQILCVER